MSLILRHHEIPYIFTDFFSEECPAESSDKPRSTIDYDIYVLCFESTLHDFDNGYLAYVRVFIIDGFEELIEASISSCI